MPLPAAPLFHALIARVRRALGLTAMMALSAAAIPYVAYGVGAPLDSSNQQVVTLPPAMAPPLLLRDVDPEDALGINAGIPFSNEPNPAARPFKIRGDDAAYNRALHCLTEAIYYEGASAPLHRRTGVHLPALAHWLPLTTA